MKIDLPPYSYEVHIGRQNFCKAAEYAEGRKVYAVTDKIVAQLYFPALCTALGYMPDATILPDGEKTKSWCGAEIIIKDLIAKGHGRNTLLIALGGGVVGDIAGFAASLFMRGIDCLHMPTTLLAAVDSSTGGKTGINFNGLKNYIGTFKQPVGVVADTEVFETLPRREIVSGMGEIVKTALLDADIFEYVAEHKNRILNLEWPYTEEIVKMCVFLKGGIVMADERDNGLRKTLNAGHTIGHALETADNFRRAHGEYILSGIYYEANVAGNLGIINGEYKNAVQSLVRSVQPDIIPLTDKQKIMAAMRRDKKNFEGGIAFILPVSPGMVQEIRIKEDIWTSL